MSQQPICTCGCPALAHRGPYNRLGYCYYGDKNCECRKYSPVAARRDAALFILVAMIAFMIGYALPL